MSGIRRTSRSPRHAGTPLPEQREDGNNHREHDEPCTNTDLSIFRLTRGCESGSVTEMEAAMQNVEMTEAMFDAFVKRDTRFDGIFYTGVRSTGIFCRPMEPSGSNPSWLNALLEELREGGEPAPIMLV